MREREAVCLAAGSRAPAARLFDGHRRQRVLVDAVLEGWGTLRADAARCPAVALLGVGFFSVLGGNPEHPVAGELIRGLRNTVIVPGSEAWVDLLLRTCGDRITRQPRTGFSLAALDPEHLRGLARRVPAGYRLRRIDPELAPAAMRDVAYGSAAEFLAHGVGFCALRDDRVACSARSYIASRSGIEISILTEPEHRRQGVATATAAALLAHCLESDIEPHWNATNPLSVGLATKLGYVANDVFDLLEFYPDGRDQAFSRAAAPGHPPAQR